MNAERERPDEHDEEPNVAANFDAPASGLVHAVGTSRVDSATLLRRTFDVDLRRCARCDGPSAFSPSSPTRTPSKDSSPSYAVPQTLPRGLTSPHHVGPCATRRARGRVAQPPCQRRSRLGRAIGLPAPAHEPRRPALPCSQKVACFAYARNAAFTRPLRMPYSAASTLPAPRRTRLAEELRAERSGGDARPVGTPARGPPFVSGA